MAVRTLAKAGSIGSILTIVVAAGLYFILPLTLIVRQAAEGIKPGGFGQGLGSLSRLSTESALLAVIPAVLATSLASMCSLLGKFAPSFRSFYRQWLLVLLFTNPVFLVFGFTVLLAPLPPILSVGIATVYVLLPLVGMVVQSAVDDFPQQQIMMARGLGSSVIGAVTRHILPGIGAKLMVAGLLGSIYALGFYLLPAFVGLGRVTTLGTTIDHAANRLGDWSAACQLCLVALLTQGILFLVWAAGRRLIRFVQED